MHIKSQPKALDQTAHEKSLPIIVKQLKIISKYNRIKGPSFKKKHSKGSSS